MFLAAHASVLVALGMTAPSSPAVAPVPATASQLGDAFARVQWNAHGLIRHAEGALGYLGPSANDVEAFLRERSAGLGLRSDERLVVVEDVRDGVGNRHVRVRRHLAGMPVEFDELRVHARPDGQVRTLEADLSALRRYTHQGPRISPWRAEDIARDGYRGPLLVPAETVPVIVGESIGIRGVRMAWRVRVAYERKGALPVVQDVYVDAATGVRLLNVPRIYTEGTPGTMGSTDLGGNNVTLNITSFPQGILLKDIVTLPNGGEIYTVDMAREGSQYETDSTSSPFDDRTAVTVADKVRAALDYYATSHSWQNWDFAQSPAGVGGLLAGRVHEGNQLNNAFFTTLSSNGYTSGIMAFGDGDGQYFVPLARCLDVTGHELGHGVVEGTAGLVYQFQSGALNEHMADVYGWLMDQEDDLIGEDCVGPQLQPALRDMCNPGNVPQPQPAHMNDYQDLPNTEEGDWGGVHTNSGIPNKAACLARDAIGAQKLGRVWFQTVRHHLGANSSFADMVQGTATSCSELTLGAGDCAQIATAWQSVGLAAAAGGGGCPPNSSEQDGQCFCNDGFRPNSEGTGCESVETVQCPAHSQPIDGQCYCDTGYVPSDDGSACVVETQGECPSNSHREGGVCVCDECYQGNPEGNGLGCDPIPGCSVCTDPLESGQNGGCQCIPGVTEVCGEASLDYVVNVGGYDYYGVYCCQESDPCGFANNGTCDCASECGFDSADCGGTNPGTPLCRGLVVGDCGNETWAGRCEGSLLIYCDDQTDPQNPVLQYADCSQQETRTVCAIDGEIGYNCVEPQNNCGSVPASGQCNGNTGQYCEEGVIREVECGDYGCGTFEYQGYTYEFCYPCPQNSTLQDDTCYCNAGYEPNPDGDGCVETGSSSGSVDGGECTPDADGGCASAEEITCTCAVPQGGNTLVSLLLFGLFVARVRRRA
ncbi:MAG: M4 family metallopeptidase [Myxococcota bacterium]